MKDFEKSKKREMLRARLQSGSEWALKRLSRFLLKRLVGRFLLYDIGADQASVLLFFFIRCQRSERRAGPKSFR